MVALWKRADHYIFALWFLLLSLYLSFFPRLISAVTDWCPSYFHTWCGLSANLRCRSETCWTRLDGNAGPKKSPKIAIWAPSHNFVGLCVRNWGTYQQLEKKLLSSNMSSTCPHNMVNFGPPMAEIGLGDSLCDARDICTLSRHATNNSV